eukprot:4911478-Prymnesium_polylepis.1
MRWVMLGSLDALIRLTTRAGYIAPASSSAELSFSSPVHSTMHRRPTHSSRWEYAAAAGAGFAGSAFSADAAAAVDEEGISGARRRAASSDAT